MFVIQWTWNRSFPHSLHLSQLRWALRGADPKAPEAFGGAAWIIPVPVFVAYPKSSSRKLPGDGFYHPFLGVVYWVSSYSNVDSFASAASIPTAKPWESEENHLQLGMGQNCLYRILRINSHLWARHLLFRPSLIDTGTWRILPLSNWLICLVIVSLQFVGLSWIGYSMLFSEMLATY